MKEPRPELKLLSAFGHFIYSFSCYLTTHSYLICPGVLQCTSVEYFMGLLPFHNVSLWEKDFLAPVHHVTLATMKIGFKAWPSSWRLGNDTATYITCIRIKDEWSTNQIWVRLTRS